MKHYKQYRTVTCKNYEINPYKYYKIKHKYYNIK